MVGAAESGRSRDFKKYNLYWSHVTRNGIDSKLCVIGFRFADRIGFAEGNRLWKQEDLQKVADCRTRRVCRR